MRERARESAEERRLCLTRCVFVRLWNGEKRRGKIRGSLMHNASVSTLISAENSARYECCRFAMPLVLLRTRTKCCGAIAGSDALRASTEGYSDMLSSVTLSRYICAL